MFIKNLKITKGSEIIHDINFKAGLNLIVDDTPTAGKKQSLNKPGNDFMF